MNTAAQVILAVSTAAAVIAATDIKGGNASNKGITNLALHKLPEIQIFSTTLLTAAAVSFLF